MINQFRVQNFEFKVFETELVTYSHLLSNFVCILFILTGKFHLANSAGEPKSPAQNPI